MARAKRTGPKDTETEACAWYTCSSCGFRK